MIAPTTARVLAAIAATVLLGACSTDDVLQVTDPDIINPTDVQSSAGATAVRNGALARLTAATSGGGLTTASANSEGLFLLSGLFADEWNNGDSFIARQEVDQRVITPANTFLTDVDRNLQRARFSAAQAITLLKQYNATGPAADVGEMYFVEAYVENIIGEHYCNGLVLGNLGDPEQYGTQTTTTAAFEMAVAHADSGLALVTGTTTADVKIVNALRLVKGRALTNLNRQAEAATAVSSVPTGFTYNIFHAQTTTDNEIWNYNNIQRRYSVSTGEGTNGLNFATAADPRIPVCQGGDARCTAAGVTLKSRDDGSAQPFYVQLIWPTRDAPVSIASGIEARMIEAEAALKAGDAAGFMAKINLPRTGVGALADPGSTTARQDLLFRERAFWLFGRGYRVGDMRRLIKQYNRAPTSVFPTGAWHKGGNYGGDVNFPVPQAEENNPNVPSGQTCLDRNA
ncbi:MAG: hypothetical protein JO180_08705 [Gemmatirosa sp.]|nr:hypothetical protein [Gemmatirosa sp.]